MNTTIEAVLYTSKTLSNGQHPIMLRLTKNRKRKYISLHISLALQYWDAEKCKPRRNCPDKERIEALIQQKTQELQSQVMDFKTSDKEYTLNTLVEKASRKVVRQTVGEYLNGYIDRLLAEKRVGNAKTFQELRTSLTKFCRSLDFYFIDIDAEWLKRYENGEFDTESAKTNTENLQIDPESWERAKEMARNILQEQMNADTGDVNENATQYIVDWILSNKDSFGEKAFGTCLGMIQNKNAYIFPSMLTQALTKAGYSSRKTLKYLADKGLIGVSVLKDGSTKNSVTKWFNNRNCRFVEFHLGDLAEEKDPLLEEEEIAEQMKPQQMSLPGTNDGWQTIPDEEADKLPFN